MLSELWRWSGVVALVAVFPYLWFRGPRWARQWMGTALACVLTVGVIGAGLVLL